MRLPKDLREEVNRFHTVGMPGRSGFNQRARAEALSSFPLVYDASIIARGMSAPCSGRGHEARDGESPRPWLGCATLTKSPHLFEPQGHICVHMKLLGQMSPRPLLTLKFSDSRIKF